MLCVLCWGGPYVNLYSGTIPDFPFQSLHCRLLYNYRSACTFAAVATRRTHILVTATEPLRLRVQFVVAEKKPEHHANMAPDGARAQPFIMPDGRKLGTFLEEDGRRTGADVGRRRGSAKARKAASQKWERSFRVTGASTTPSSGTQVSEADELELEVRQLSA